MKFCNICFLATILALSTCNRENPVNGGTVKEPSDWTVSGTVTCSDGTRLEGVVVSDGVNCVKTDAKGRYYLSSDLSATDYVFVSTPSEYSAPVESGMATFWKFLRYCPSDSEGRYTADFTLYRISNPECYSVMLFADPQPRNSGAARDKVGYHSLDICEDMYHDMRDLVSDVPGRKFYGIGLGDIVHQDLSLLANYLAGMATTGVTTYNVIGNHDHGHRFMADDLSSKDFEEQMGPVNYSFNLGGIHYLILDNMISPDPSTEKYCDDCATGLTDRIWQYVQNDLALVPHNVPLMVCAHSPMMRMENGKNRSGQHLDDLRALLANYPKAYVWAGHTHATFNYVDLSNPVIESHTVSRVTGAFWTNDWLGANGTPRGYVIMDYNNGDISWWFKPLYFQAGAWIGRENDGTPDYTWRDWDYDSSGRAIMKATGKPLGSSYQMQLFPPGTYDEGDGYVYANIFLWDEAWKMPQFTSASGSTPMERVTDSSHSYSYSDWSITSFYHKNTRIGADYVPSTDNCRSIFRVRVPDAHGSGSVSVTDRFGKTYSSTINW